MLYTSQKSALGAASAAGPLFEAVRKLSLSGRDVTLRTRSTPAFEAGIHSRAVVLIAAGGAFLSLLLALTVWSLAAGRMRAQTLAARMTIELDRLAQVVRHTSNSVTISDAQRRIVWINEGFTRISGYSSAEALGRTPGELLACDKADPGVLALLKSAAVAGESVRAEVINRAKDGREYWIDTEVQPLRDAQGQVTGFMEIGSDITDKRDAARELARERPTSRQHPAWDECRHVGVESEDGHHRGERALGRDARLCPARTRAVHREDLDVSRAPG